MGAVILDDDDSFESRRMEGTIMLKQVVDSAKAKQGLYNGFHVGELAYTPYSFQSGPMSFLRGFNSDDYKVFTDKGILSLSKEEWKALVSEAERKAWKAETTSEWQGEAQYTYHKWKPE